MPEQASVPVGSAAPAPAAGTTQPAAPAPAAGAAPAGPGLGMFLPMLLVLGFFWFFMIRPQQKQQKEREAALKALKEGDRVVLVSGVHASVAKVEDGDVLRLQIAEGVVIKAQRSAVDRKLA